MMVQTQVKFRVFSTHVRSSFAILGDDRGGHRPTTSEGLQQWQEEDRIGGSSSRDNVQGPRQTGQDGENAHCRQLFQCNLPAFLKLNMSACARIDKGCVVRLIPRPCFGGM